MMSNRAHRSLAPPGTTSMAGYIGSSRAGFGAGSEEEAEGLSLERAMVRRLRPKALRRLWNLVQHGGELPCDGSPGVMLPPFTLRFFGDELGCREAQAEVLLEQLEQEGLLVAAGSVYRVPEPRALLSAGFS